MQRGRGMPRSTISTFDCCRIGHCVRFLPAGDAVPLLALYGMVLMKTIHLRLITLYELFVHFRSSPHRFETNTLQSKYPVTYLQG